MIAKLAKRLVVALGVVLFICSSMMNHCSYYWLVLLFAAIFLSAEYILVDAFSTPLARNMVSFSQLYSATNEDKSTNNESLKEELLTRIDTLVSCLYLIAVYVSYYIVCV